MSTPSRLRLAARAERRAEPEAMAVFRLEELAVGRRLEYRGLSATVPTQRFEVIGIERWGWGKGSTYEPGAVVQHRSDRLILRDLDDPDVSHSLQAITAVAQAGWWLVGGTRR